MGKVAHTWVVHRNWEQPQLRTPGLLARTEVHICMGYRGEDLPMPKPIFRVSNNHIASIAYNTYLRQYQVPGSKDEYPGLEPSPIPSQGTGSRFVPRLSVEHSEFASEATRSRVARAQSI